MKSLLRSLRFALGTLAATFCGTASAQTPAVYPSAPLSGYYRAGFPWLANNTAGFYYTKIAQWPGQEPPVQWGATNINGAPLQMQTLYTTDTRTFTISQVLAFHTNGACGCELVPAYYVMLQIAPSGQGFYPGQWVHNNFATYYFCCSYADGSGQTLLLQWDTTQGSAAMSINGQPWIGAFASQVAGTPFNVGLGSEYQVNMVEGPVVNYWPNFSQAATNFIGAMGLTHIIIWGNGYNPYNAVDLSGSTATYPINYGLGGNFSEFGSVEDYLIWP